MKNDFNLIAPIYDSLSYIVFRNKLKQVQKIYLDLLIPNSKVLIIGGGTGKILQWLPPGKNLEVTYVELSRKMLELARSRSYENMVKLYQADIMDFHGEFDYVIANFFLDCFDSDNLKKVISKFSNLLTNKGSILVTDFKYNTDQRDGLLRKIMHWFFKIVSNLESDHLLDIHTEVLESGFNKLKYQVFDRGQLFSAVYKMI